MPTYPIADAHCDFLYYNVTKQWNIATHTERQTLYLPYMQEGGVALQFFAAWMDADMKRSFWQQCTDMLDAYDAMLYAHSAVLVPFSADYTPQEGRIACLPTVEGGEVLEGKLERLDTLYKRGVRAMTLTWNYRNELAYPASGRRNAGLTRLGKEAVDRMCALGIAVDLSHLNDAGIDDVLSRATRPVFASHSNARDVYMSKRSLLDTQIKAVADGGGVVCVNYYPRQLCGGVACIDDVVRHIDHMCALVGAEHVGLGSDFDGMNVYPRDLRDPRDVPALLARLETLGYTQEQVGRIAYGNLRDYIAKFC